MNKGLSVTALDPLLRRERGVMQDPYRTMVETKEKVDHFVKDEASSTSFTLDELQIIQAALEYATTEWWDALKDKEE